MKAVLRYKDLEILPGECRALIESRLTIIESEVQLIEVVNRDRLS